LFALSICCSCLQGQDSNQQADLPNVVPLKRAHAHNDYQHPRPLLDALELGFTSIEADVFLVEGKLLVAHTVFELYQAKSFEAAYLKPLAERFDRTGSIYPGSDEELILLVDFKTDPVDTYAVLAKLLKKYDRMLVTLKNGSLLRGAVRIVISGNRPVEAIARERDRFAFLDGRMQDLTDQTAATITPLISESWNHHFAWRGQGEMPESDLAKLKTLAAAAHSQQTKLRFWGVPDHELAWQKMYDAEVDLINTDNLPGLAKFLRTKLHDRELGSDVNPETVESPQE
jgi:hypothetical protein